MSSEQLRVCSCVLEDAFGGVVEKVATHLISHGPLTLSQIVKKMKETSRSDIKKCLLVLIQHQLVSYSTQQKSNQVAYKAELTTVLGMIRYPRHVLTGQELGKETGEMIIEDILTHGQTSLIQCVRRVAQLSNSTTNLSNCYMEIKTEFERLVERRYIVKVKTHSFDNASSNQPIPASEQFSLPHLTINQLIGRKRLKSPKDGEEPVAKRSKTTAEDTEEHNRVSNEDVLWFLNLEQFHMHYRHQSIIQAVAEKIDPTSSMVIKGMIKAAENEQRVAAAAGGVVQPLYSPKGQEVYPSQVLEQLPNTLTMDREELDQYLTLLMEEQFVTKTGDAGGGSYCINYRKCSERLCVSMMESVIRERFGSKHLRLFRLLVQKGHLEQKQISDMALIPNKESKEMLYSLLAENFISLQEIPRSTDYMPSRTFYLFYVNKTDVARVVLQKCYKALGNLMARRKYELNENKRLLEKYAQWEKQQLNSKEDGEPAADVEEVITPSEKEVAEKVKFTIEKLQHGELQLDYSILLVEDYLRLLKDKVGQK